MSERKVKRLNIWRDSGLVDEDSQTYSVPTAKVTTDQIGARDNLRIAQILIHEGADKSEVIELLIRLTDWLDANWETPEAEIHFDDMRHYETLDNSDDLWDINFGDLEDLDDPDRDS